MALDANDMDARWALVYCLARKGDAQGAWNTPSGDPVPPRDQQDARTWIALMAMYDTSEHFVSRALATMKRWPDDEEFLGIFIAQIYSGLRRDELTPAEPDLDALRQATADYVQRFPDSPVFRSFPVGSDDDPLSSIVDKLKKQHERHEAFADVETKVRAGEQPLGMLASVTGHSYAEAAMRRAAGMVRSHRPHRHTQAVAELLAAINGPVALDTTAAATLALLDPTVVAQLTGQFTRLESTDPAFRDALSAQWNARRKWL